MYKCQACGKDTPNREPDYFTQYHPGKYPDNYYSYCDKCKEKVQEQIEFENEQISDNIVCPACGVEFTDDTCEFVKANEEEYQCESCGAWFEITANHTIDYTTKRIKK